MPSTIDTSSPASPGNASPNLFPSPSTLGGDDHNTIYQRMMARVGTDENSVPLVLACVAYSMYKNEKRQWITGWCEKNGTRPTPEQVTYYVSSWSDLRIESTFAAAKLEIDNFVEAVVELTKEDLSGEVYQALFRGTADQIRQHSQESVSRANTISALIRERTQSNWFLSACADIVVSVIANFIWFALTIVILIGLYAQFDFSKFMEKTKGLFSAQDPSTQQEKSKSNL